MVAIDVCGTISTHGERNIMIDSNIPFDKIINFGQRTMLNSKLFSVSWILARFCNYDCSYCWPYAKSKQKDHRPLSVYTALVDEIKRQARQNGFTDYHFSFSGGEPTAYKDFLQLVQHYSADSAPEYQSIHMTTNLSPSEKWWERWLEATKTLNRRSITASFHAEFADEQKFGDKILLLMKHNVFVTINQVMVPDRFTEYYDRCARFNSRGINVTLKPQSDPTASHVVEGYTKDQLNTLQTGFPQRIQEGKNYKDLFQIEMTDAQGNKYYMDQAERFNAFGFNKFKGWHCNAGYQSCVIREPGGEVKRSYSCHDEPLGSIEQGFKLFDKPRICVTPTCVSSADSKIPKAKHV